MTARIRSSPQIQLSGETDRSRAEFLRGQRQVLYVQVISDYEKLRAAEYAYPDPIVKVGPMPKNFGKEAGELEKSR